MKIELHQLDEKFLVVVLVHKLKEMLSFKMLD